MHACNSVLASGRSWSFSTKNTKESKPEGWTICNKRSTVRMFMKEDSGNHHQEVFVNSDLPLIFPNMFIWLLFLVCFTMMAQKLSWALHIDGQTALQSKYKTKDNRPI